MLDWLVAAPRCNQKSIIENQQRFNNQQS